MCAIGAGLIHLSADGDVLTHSVPFGYDGYPIRRAQALAIANGLDLDLARISSISCNVRTADAPLVRYPSLSRQPCCKRLKLS